MTIPVIIGQILLYVTLSGLCFWGIKHGITLYIFSRKKEAINKLQARISILKLHLKGKVKRKCNKIRDVFSKEDPDTLKVLQPKLDQIIALDFSSANDYQKLVSTLITITQDISYYIKIKHKALLKQIEIKNTGNAKEESEEKAPPTEEERVTENCKKLVKYDKAHMLIIIEIIQATTTLIESINEYNMLVAHKKNSKKITEIPHTIEIENYELIANLVDQSKNSKDEATDFQILGKDLFDKAG